MTSLSLFLSLLFQILGFLSVLYYFHAYIAERKGIEYHSKILNGAKLYRDEKGVNKNLKLNLRFLILNQIIFTMVFSH